MWTTELTVDEALAQAGVRTGRRPRSCVALRPGAAHRVPAIGVHLPDQVTVLHDQTSHDGRHDGADRRATCCARPASAWVDDDLVNVGIARPRPDRPADRGDPREDVDAQAGVPHRPSGRAPDRPHAVRGLPEGRASGATTAVGVHAHPRGHARRCGGAQTSSRDRWCESRSSKIVVVGTKAASLLTPATGAEGSTGALWRLRVGRQPAGGQRCRLLRAVPVLALHVGVGRRHRQPDRRQPRRADLPCPGAVRRLRCRPVAGLRPAAVHADGDCRCCGRHRVGCSVRPRFVTSLPSSTSARPAVGSELRRRRQHRPSDRPGGRDRTGRRRRRGRSGSWGR